MISPGCVPFLVASSIRAECCSVSADVVSAGDASGTGSTSVPASTAMTDAAPGRMTNNHLFKVPAQRRLSGSVKVTISVCKGDERTSGTQQLLFLHIPGIEIVFKGLLAFIEEPEFNTEYVIFFVVFDHIHDPCLYSDRYLCCILCGYIETDFNYL